MGPATSSRTRVLKSSSVNPEGQLLYFEENHRDWEGHSLRNVASLNLLMSQSTLVCGKIWTLKMLNQKTF